MHCSFNDLLNGAGLVPAGVTSGATDRSMSLQPGFGFRDQAGIGTERRDEGCWTLVRLPVRGPGVLIEDGHGRMVADPPEVTTPPDTVVTVAVETGISVPPEVTKPPDDVGISVAEDTL